MAVPSMQLSTGSKPQSPMSDLTPRARSTERFSLNGKVAIVTGGTGVLGHSTSSALLDHGATHVALFDQPSPNGPSTAAALAQMHDATVEFFGVDVTDEESVEAAVRDVVRKFGKIDVLCCFAGIVNCRTALEYTVAEFRRMLDVNTTGCWVVARAVANQMRTHQSPGSIVLISSISGHSVNFPQAQVAYNVSKAGVLHMVRSLAAEWAQYGIRVNSISPGYMDTVLNEGTHLDVARKTWTDRTPLGRLGQPNELDGPVVLLCSDAGSFITGADIKVDGGITVF